MSDLKTSVVVTTFNGRKYIKEQLDSLKNQTVPFDEVLILDDCSSDGTPDFIADYIQKYELNSWRLIRNKENQGWKKNFKLGFDMASGDLIYPCDQDDIWDLEKNEIMSKVLWSDNSINVLSTNFKTIIEGDRRFSGYTRNEKRMTNNESVIKVEFDEKWSYTRRPGCTYCFRRSFYEEIKTLWNTEYAHDSILWCMAILSNSLGLLQKPLITFRRHGDNATSLVKKSRSELIKYSADTRAMYLNYKRIAEDQKNYDKEIIIQRGIDFLANREKMLKKRSIMLWIMIFAKYNDCYLFRTGVIKDLISIIKQ